MHAQSSIDVTTIEFQRELDIAGKAFAAAGIAEMLEINIAGHLFPVGKGQVTIETTDEIARRQLVTVGPKPVEIESGNWSSAACWGFTPDGIPQVTGTCTVGDTTFGH